MRTYLLVGEHVTHCPDRCAQVLHLVLENARVDVQGSVFRYAIDLDVLHKGLAEARACALGAPKGR
jgi:hypothetical protein